VHKSRRIFACTVAPNIFKITAAVLSYTHTRASARTHPAERATQQTSHGTPELRVLTPHRIYRWHIDCWKICGPLIDKCQCMVRIKAYRGRTSIAPVILNTGTSWEVKGHFTNWPLYPLGENATASLNMRLGRPQIRSGRFGEKTSCHQRESNPEPTKF